jgi:hypothetical protein
MNRRKMQDLAGMWVMACSLLLISLLLLGMLFILGQEMVVRLNAQITQGVQDFSLSQKERLP